MAGVEVPLAVCIGLAMLVSSIVLLLEFDPSDMSRICPGWLPVALVDSCRIRVLLEDDVLVGL